MRACEYQTYIFRAPLLFIVFPATSSLSLILFLSFLGPFVMCWIVFLLRMMVKKREPVESEDAYTLANRDRDGYVEEEDVKKDSFDMGNLPVDLVCKVFSQVSRLFSQLSISVVSAHLHRCHQLPQLQSSSSIRLQQFQKSDQRTESRCVCEHWRRQNCGWFTIQTLSVMWRSSRLVLARTVFFAGKALWFRKGREPCSSEMLMSPSRSDSDGWAGFSRNYSQRKFKNNVTPQIASAIIETFAKSNVESVKVKANTISYKTKDLLNSLKCLRVTLNIGHYDENVAEVANVSASFFLVN